MNAKKGHDLKKTLVSTTGLVVLLVTLILVNVIFSYANLRWDVTEDKIHSLSQGTKSILAKVTEPVTIRYFFSTSNPNLPANI